MRLPRLYKPYLVFHFDVGLVRISTEIMTESFLRDEFVYIALRWQAFKWSGQSRLYRPGYDK